MAELTSFGSFFFDYAKKESKISLEGLLHRETPVENHCIKKDVMDLLHKRTRSRKATGFFRTHYSSHFHQTLISEAP
tara:strand:+ start:96033 stop:96263 length:231 start_codon:yes stop_codon:yes gene_type:complete